MVSVAALPADLALSVRRVGRLVGNTPLYEITRAWSKPGVRLFAKLEWFQLGGSVKARPAYNMIRQAVETGRYRPGQTLLDATSGNTGIAYASICAALGIPVTLCLPENASRERKLMLESLGVQLILTDRFESTDGAQTAARALVSEFPDKYFYPDQYNNPDNWDAHRLTTAPEIWNQTEGQITHWVAGLGTTGTFTGTTRGLRSRNPEIRCVALQPETAMHGLEGWKHLETAKVPGIYDPNVADEVRTVDTLEAYKWVRRVAQTEGILLSPSAAANLAGAIQVAEELETGTVVTVFADNSDKYSDVTRLILSDAYGLA